MSFKKTIYLSLISIFLFSCLLSANIGSLGVKHQEMNHCPLMLGGNKLCQKGLVQSLSFWQQLFTFSVSVLSLTLLAAFLFFTKIVFYTLLSKFKFYCKFQPQLVEAQFLRRILADGILHPQLYA